jgi:hypothetical protein
LNTDTMLYMPVLEFIEIPEAHLATGKQDSFEFFAADFLEMLGYEVPNRPGRGADLGKDLLVIEKRAGIGGETRVKWLVSCKHKVHSGRAVGLDDEQNLVERVEGHSCGGFIGFYSTLPSSSLNDRLNQLRSRFEVQVFDRERIEGQLLRTAGGILVAKRYMPDSMSRWMREHPIPAQIFSDAETLRCDYCGADLLDPVSGIFVVWRKWDEASDLHEVVDFRWCCKGDCDRKLKTMVRTGFDFKVLDAWDDIEDMCNPTLFIWRLMSWFNRVHAGEKWADAPFERLRTMLLAVFPHVARELSTSEQEAVQGALRIPGYLGGMG